MRNLFKRKHYPIKQITFSLLSATLLFCAGCGSQQTQASDGSEQPLKTVGWIEKGNIVGLDEPLEFKLDTGATTTSINAEIISKPDNETEAGGMIKFRFINGDDTSAVFERPITRWVKIKDGEGGYFRRPVVEMKLCIAGRWVEEEVNLADRDQFNYSVLIGRNMLKKGNLAIDSNKKFTNKSECKGQEVE
ncbi:ATP-dependent zinc protease family protein [Crocosphaera chwakensis]|uniref:Retropepsin-like aspartic endopeptidase domain-containing protein n=1 Tax=Crocosphaera chwakensis CCY0110 TaxID=391612 RepID=A3IUT8_9CHRO|nr:RimK/LysX family protein [Crocosphaera chwakensis]EAZ89781.1 hypothetical protein CY0110_29219 [Crocosphaera chwakensis CCY0110]